MTEKHAKNNMLRIMLDDLSSWINCRILESHGSEEIKFNNRSCHVSLFGDILLSYDFNMFSMSNLLGPNLQSGSSKF